MANILYPENSDGLLRYSIAEGVTAFSTLKSTRLSFPVLQAHQVHSDNVAIIDSINTTDKDLYDIDAMITDIPGFAIGVRTADCVPVLLFDPEHKVIAAIHSGWRGTVKRISCKVIRIMGERFGTTPGTLRAVIGPCIGFDSFQIGHEVVDEFKKSNFLTDSILRYDGERKAGSMSGGFHLNLAETNRLLLLESGLKSKNIVVTNIDTYTNENFFSARREGVGCGRTINAIMIDQGTPSML